jgi:hypothetical protein
MMPASSQFNLAAAEQAAKNGELESFVLTYLEGPGDNLAFADGIRLERRWWRGPFSIVNGYPNLPLFGEFRTL